MNLLAQNRVVSCCFFNDFLEIVERREIVFGEKSKMRAIVAQTNRLIVVENKNVRGEKLI